MSRASLAGWVRSLWNALRRHKSEPSPTAWEIQQADPVFGDPSRAETVTAIKNRLTDLGLDEGTVLVDRIVARFGLMVGLLPASAEYHHARPWGLLDHSLEVALRAVTASLEIRFSEEGASSDPGREYELLPRWRYAAFVFGLLHDIGKIVQVRVASKLGEEWNPFTDPLAAFLLRSGQWPPNGEPLSLEWRPKRGLETHERYNPFFVARILTSRAAEYLGPILAHIVVDDHGPGQTLAALISAADQESVVADRRTRIVDPANVEPARAPNLADHLAPSLQRSLEVGSLSTNRIGADGFLGERYLALRYPAAILKLMQEIRERRPDDPRVKCLHLDEAGVKAFVHELVLRQFVFRDRESATWKLRATITHDGAEEKTFLILIRKEILETGAFRPFAGQIRLYSLVDMAPVVIDDFSVADAPSAATSEPTPKAKTAEEEPVSLPVPAMIDPDQLTEKIRELVLRRTIPVNVAQGLVYVTPETTFLVWPRAFALIREAMGLPFNPFEDKRPYYAVLSQMPFVERDDRGNVIFSIKFRPDAPNLCRVVRMKTEGLFPDKKVLATVGFWAEGDKIQPAPPEARIERRESA